METILQFVIDLVIAGAIIFAGSWAARYISNIIDKAESKAGLPAIASNVGYWVVIVFIWQVALGTLGVDLSFITNLVLTFVTGAVSALALGVGLAFGLGNLEKSVKQVQKMMK